MMLPMTSHSRLSARELAIIFAFWTSLATLSAVNQLVEPRGYGFRVIAIAYVESWLWAAFTPLIFSLASRLSIRSRWFVQVPILLAAGFAIALIVYLILTYARIEIFELPRRGSVGFRFANQLLVFCAVLAAGYAREYFLRDQDRQREAGALHAQLADARLEALRAQINPHFLFNTLNAVAALVERDPAGARRMIARLSELLRYTIDSRGSATVPLREELEFLERYIEIMEIRFQGRLRASTKIDAGALDAPVPSLILQPIVENALEHGASRAAGDGKIEIEAHRDGGRLVLSVRDNGPGVREGEGGIGLSNTRARLEQLYGSAASLTLASAPDGGAIAIITIPMHG